jgi:hypothetical protein
MTVKAIIKTVLIVLVVVHTKQSNKKAPLFA